MKSFQSQSDEGYCTAVISGSLNTSLRNRAQAARNAGGYLLLDCGLVRVNVMTMTSGFVSDFLFFYVI